MGCKVSEDKLISYLYGELTVDDKKAYESHLNECVICKAEFSSFSKVRALIRKTEPLTPKAESCASILREAELFLAPKGESGQRQVKKGFWAQVFEPIRLFMAKPVVGIAGGILVMGGVAILIYLTSYRSVKTEHTRPFSPAIAIIEPKDQFKEEAVAMTPKTEETKKTAEKVASEDMARKGEDESDKKIRIGVTPKGRFEGMKKGAREEKEGRFDKDLAKDAQKRPAMPKSIEMDEMISQKPAEKKYDPELTGKVAPKLKQDYAINKTEEMEKNKPKKELKAVPAVKTKATVTPKTYQIIDNSKDKAADTKVPQIRKKPEPADNLTQAQIYEKAKNYPRALENYLKVPHKTETVYQSIIRCYRNLNDYKNARIYYQRVIKAYPAPAKAKRYQMEMKELDSLK